MPTKPIVNELVELSALVARPPPHLGAVECAEPIDEAVPAGQSLGLDLIDSMPIATLPDELSSVAAPSIKRLSTDLARGGHACGAARRLAARDVAIARVRLRLLESLQATALSRIGEDRNAARDAEALQRMIGAEHRRLLGAMELLRRTERGRGDTTVKINRAAIMINPVTP